MLDNVPAELRAYKSFVLWRLEEQQQGKPTKVPYSAAGKHADVNRPETWCDFETARAALNDFPDYFSGLGFVLSENDPFAFIDLDDPYDSSRNFTPEESQKIADRHQLIHSLFDSYSEISPSGKGLHILCKGSVAQGRKRAQVEVYSNQRFMTVTGNVCNFGQICDRQELLSELWSEMSKGVEVYTDIPDQPQKESDDDVCRIAYGAVNGAKFLDLYKGNWQPYYSSQSEADFGLIDIVAFYTKNRAQITRIFRMSALGQRDKAWRNDYVDRMILRSFDQELPPVDLEGLKIMVESALMARQTVAEQKTDPKPEPIVSQPDTFTHTTQSSHIYTRPPGIVGMLADFIFEAAYTPVYEIALAGAIGFLSGVCGRAYNINGTGLNQYVLLIAPTGIGKEAMRKGIDKVVAQVAMISPNIKSFIGPREIASQQALGKHFHRHSKSFVAMPGEVGLWLQSICNPMADPARQGIKKMLLELYNISGKGDVFKATINSDKDNSIEQTIAPAFSLLGESTPEEFYKVLDDAMISSGLLPRFTIIEYKGYRPDSNENGMFATPCNSLVQGLAAISTNALALNDTNEVINVNKDDDAAKMLKSWEDFCVREVNIGIQMKSGTRSQLWNRGHMKSLKLAALIAVGVNPFHPMITGEIAKWAIEMEFDQIKKLLSRFDSGEIGHEGSEGRQVIDMVECISNYLRSAYKDVQVYKVDKSLHADRIVPYSYLHKRLMQRGSYTSEKRGSPTDAIKRVLNTLMERGDICEVPRGDLASKYSSRGRAFMIANTSSFNI